jgi:hypothetical protein
VTGSSGSPAERSISPTIGGAATPARSCASISLACRRFTGIRLKSCAKRATALGRVSMSACPARRDGPRITLVDVVVSDVTRRVRLSLSANVRNSFSPVHGSGWRVASGERGALVREPFANMRTTLATRLTCRAIKRRQSPPDMGKTRTWRLPMTIFKVLTPVPRWGTAARTCCAIVPIVRRICSRLRAVP